MKQRPIVRLLAVCGGATLVVPPSGDSSDGWWELKNLYHSVWMPPGISKGFGVERLFVYAQLTDGLGEFSFGTSVELIDLAVPKRNQRLQWSDPKKIVFETPWDVVEQVFELRNVPFPKPGQYEFRINEGGQILDGGSLFLRVKAGDQS